MTMIAIAQAVALDTTTTYVSIGVLIVVLGAAVRITQLLTRISEQLKQALDKLAVLEPIPGKVALIEQRMATAEREIAELWDLHRKIA